MNAASVFCLSLAIIQDSGKNKADNLYSCNEGLHCFLFLVNNAVECNEIRDIFLNSP